jgi:beta-N-acetylhexosaminidase
VDGNTRLVVFALGAPYYLDSTEVSKLSAYFALYGAHRPFIDVAARALFADSTPVGHSPVTVAAVDYRIENVTFPDANQNISLSYTLERAGTPVPAAPGEPLVPQQGDTLRLFTDVIVDQNGNSVPDGTVVQFIINYANQGIRDTIQVETSAGVAETAIALNQQGRLLISAVSPPALRSDTIELDEGIDIFTPTPGTATPTPTLPPTPQASNNPVAVATPTPTARPAREEDGSVDFADLYLSVFGLVVMASGVFGYSYRSRDLNYALLLALPIGLGGLLAYNYYALLLPGALMWRNLLGDTWAPPLASWVGGTAGLAMIIAAMNGWLPLRRSR